jgi:hypothetical protein
MTPNFKAFLFVIAVLLLACVPAAFAKDIAVARPADGVVLTLTDERSGCDWDLQAKRVRLQENGQTFLGCYIVVDGYILISWDDGDGGRVPTAIFKPTV